MKLSLKYTLIIVLLNISLFLISLWGIKNLNVENSFINYFKKDSEIYKGMKLIDNELGGTTPLDIIIKFKNNLITDEIDNSDNLDDDLELDLEIGTDIFSESNFPLDEVWFNDEKLEVIKKIHIYLENKK